MSEPWQNPGDEDLSWMFPNPDGWIPKPKWVLTDVSVATRVELPAVSVNVLGTQFYSCLDEAVRNSIRIWLEKRRDEGKPLPRISRSIVRGRNSSESLTVVFSRAEVRGVEREVAIDVELLASRISALMRKRMKKAA